MGQWHTNQACLTIVLANIPSSSPRQPHPQANAFALPPSQPSAFASISTLSIGSAMTTRLPGNINTTLIGSNLDTHPNPGLVVPIHPPQQYQALTEPYTPSCTQDITSDFILIWNACTCSSVGRVRTIWWVPNTALSYYPICFGKVSSSNTILPVLTVSIHHAAHLSFS